MHCFTGYAEVQELQLELFLFGVFRGHHFLTFFKLDTCESGDTRPHHLFIS
jgi:hypothetical protein